MPHNSYFFFNLYWICYNIQFNSVKLLSSVRLFVTPGTAACQASLYITNSRSLLKLSPLSWWCHPAISSSGVPFSSRFQSFPASGSFPMSQFFTSGGQTTLVSASTSVLPIYIQDWFPLGWTGWISLLSKGLSRVFSSHEISLSYKKDHIWVSSNEVDETGAYYSEWSKS